MKNIFKRRKNKKKEDEIKVCIEPSLLDKVKAIDGYITYCADIGADANYVGSYLAYKKKLEQEEKIRFRKEEKKYENNN